MSQTRRNYHYSLSLEDWTDYQARIVDPWLLQNSSSEDVLRVRIKKRKSIVVGAFGVGRKKAAISFVNQLTRGPSSTAGAIENKIEPPPCLSLNHALPSLPPSSAIPVNVNDYVFTDHYEYSQRCLAASKSGSSSSSTTNIHSRPSHRLPSPLPHQVLSGKGSFRTISLSNAALDVFECLIEVNHPADVPSRLQVLEEIKNNARSSSTTTSLLYHQIWTIGGAERYPFSSTHDVFFQDVDHVVLLFDSTRKPTYKKDLPEIYGEVVARCCSSGDDAKKKPDGGPHFQLTIGCTKMDVHTKEEQDIIKAAEFRIAKELSAHHHHKEEKQQDRLSGEHETLNPSSAEDPSKPAVPSTSPINFCSSMTGEGILDLLL